LKPAKEFQETQWPAGGSECLLRMFEKRGSLVTYIYRQKYRRTGLSPFGEGIINQKGKFPVCFRGSGSACEPENLNQKNTREIDGKIEWVTK
jgi:hypothetical protein